MSLDMLPKVLQNMVETLLCNNSVSSWNIRGFDSYTQVSIRFSSGEVYGMDDGPGGQVTDRKVPPLQVMAEVTAALAEMAVGSLTSMGGPLTGPQPLPSVTLQAKLVPALTPVKTLLA